MTLARTILALLLGAALTTTPNVAGAADRAADFTLRDVEGNSVTLASLKGQVVLISFWATWCGPCKEEMPHLQKMYTDLKDRGFTVLSISTDDARTASRVKPFVVKMGFSFPVLLDRDSTVVSTYNPSKTMPYTVIIDRNGEIALKHSGYNPGDEVEMRTLVDSLVAAPVPAL